MQPQRPQLPPEVVDHILSLLWDDHPCLGRCAVANKAFSALVERHLYRQITLRNFGLYNERRFKQLKSHLTDTPRLRSYVRILRIRFARPPMNEGRIGEILHLFSSITTISLSVDVSYSSQLLWKELHKGFQEAFARMLVRTSAKVISIDGIENFPLPLLNHCKYVNYLSLARINDPSPIIDDLSIDLSHNNERAQLITLLIDCQLGVDTILRWLQSSYSPGTRHLSSLHIAVYNSDHIQRLQDLLEDCSCQMKEISLLTHEIGMSDPLVLYNLISTTTQASTVYNMADETVFIREDQPLNLNGFRSLKTLSIAATIQSMDAYWLADGDAEPILYTCIPWFIRLLQTFGTQIALENINLEISFLVDRDPLTKLRWQPLTRILTSEPFSSSLRNVHLRAKCSELPTLDRATLISILQSDIHLGPLVESGLLSINEYLPPQEPS